MRKGIYKFASESVTGGHPDKVSDQISDAILDACLKEDPNSRVACETFVTTNFVLVGGEITTKGNLDFDKIIRNKIKEIGYVDVAGFDANNVEIMNKIHEQSPDISQGVTEGEGAEKEQGAGDQGMMFGYACKETNELMPLPIYLAHKLTEKLTEVRENGTLNFLKPDGKSQVTVVYEDGNPLEIENITIAAHHSEAVSKEYLDNRIMEEVVKKVIPENLVKKDIKEITTINGTGRFVVGGPHGDSGLTGRKIIVDTYGGMGRHGGGAFSGKDPSKVDRSANYMCRYIAKNIVAADLADRCEIHLSYTIGVAEPRSFSVHTFGTGKVSDEKIEEAVRKVFDLKPKEIVETLKLKNPIYAKTASNGHFGKEPFEENGNEFFTWEKTDKVNELKEAIN